MGSDTWLQLVQNRSDPPAVGGEEPVGLVLPDTDFSADGKSTEKQNTANVLEKIEVNA